MRSKVRLLQILIREMRVHLSRGRVSVAKHLLKGSQITTTGKKMSGEAVAQGVRGHPTTSSRSLGMPTDDSVEALSRECSPALVDKHTALLLYSNYLGPPLLEPLSKRTLSITPDRHHPLFAALTDHPERSLNKVQACELKPGDLAGTKTTRVHRLQDCSVTNTCGRSYVRLRKKSADFRSRKYLGQPPIASW